MEIYTTKDKTVSKFVHNDGSETAIKTVGTCNKIFNPMTEQLSVQEDRNKYVVFISSSVGCPVKCKFCYLTAKKFPYYTLTSQEIIENVKRALDLKISESPELRDKYIKLSFMGMGDAQFSCNQLSFISVKIMDYVLKNGYALGLDSIDVGTTLPNKNTIFLFISNMNWLNEIANKYQRNPLAIKNSTPARLFFSLHSFDQKIRGGLIPPTKNYNPVEKALQLQTYADTDLIFHQIFFKGINDSDEQVDSFIQTYNKYFQNNELRVLQLNECEHSRVEKTDRSKKILQKLNDNIEFLKVQHSAGSEIKASCGQFLMRKMEVLKW